MSLLPHLDLGNTFGALFIGVTLAAVLFGITNVQALVYFQTHRATGMTFHKLAVICLWTLDALHLALIIHCVYYYLVINYANISVLTEIVWSFKLQIVIDIFIIYGVHALYAYRIWIVGKGHSRIIPAIVGIVIILVSGVGIAIIWAIYQSNVFSDMLKNKWVTYMAFGVIVVVDFVIASSLCYLLATSRTGFSSTDSFLTKLMAYTINTGCLTGVFSVAAIITGAVMPTNFIFLSIEFVIAKLYVNSYLALLNARYYLQPADSTKSSDGHIRHAVYHPGLHVDTSQNENFQMSLTNVYKPPEEPEAALRLARPVQTVMPQQPIRVMMEMSSFSSAC